MIKLSDWWEIVNQRQWEREKRNHLELSADLLHRGDFHDITVERPLALTSFGRVLWEERIKDLRTDDDDDDDNQAGHKRETRRCNGHSVVFSSLNE